MNELLAIRILSKTVTDGGSPIAIAQFAATLIVFRLTEVQRGVADDFAKETTPLPHLKT